MESWRENNWWGGRAIKWAAKWCGRLRLSGTATSERKVEAGRQRRVSHHDFDFPPLALLIRGKTNSFSLLVSAWTNSFASKLMVESTSMMLWTHSGSQLSFKPKALNCHPAGCYWCQLWHHKGGIYYYVCISMHSNLFIFGEFNVISEAFVVKNIKLKRLDVKKPQCYYVAEASPFCIVKFQMSKAQNATCFQ